MKPQSNGWYSHTEFSEFSTALKSAADKHMAWLDQIDMKYLEVRVDMRTGDFLVKNAQGHVVDNLKLHKLLNLEHLEIL